MYGECVKAAAHVIIEVTGIGYRSTSVARLQKFCRATSLQHAYVYAAPHFTIAYVKVIFTSV